MEHIAEQELLQLIRNSDYAAFEEMHRRNYKSLFRLAAKKIGDPDEADDLLQDMFIELWEKRDGFYINNPLTNYLRNRLWFKLSGYFRTRAFRDKHFKHFSDFLQNEHEFFMDETEIRELDLQYEAVMDVINRTVANMPHKMREVFLLSRNSQYSTAEIAEQLNISPKTVENQITNAFNRIREATSDPALPAFELLVLMSLMYW